MADQKQFCTFYLDNHMFGVKVEQVQEVFRYQEMTTVPLAPAVVRGLINLRGQIITAIDLRQRLGMVPLTGDKLPMNVVVRTEDGVVSLLVDEIGDVLEVPEDVYERPPETIPREVRQLVLGVYKLTGKLLLILDSEKAVNVNTGALMT
ncbi:MAG: chemotaxis protein CheW [Nitrospinae bacterium CG22_combo_CG10-13_8_21_14_all_47_10]|nr:MAG: chemotaxis protein CheW [Nitrospinae bacterium CG22_combo_CG10-13_8_21_14_all_47_10]